MIAEKYIDEVQKMLDKDLVGPIVDMFKRKGMNVKLTQISGTSVWEQYTDIHLLIDVKESERILKTTIKLKHSILFDADCCGDIEKAGNFKNLPLSYADRIKLRILWTIFQACKVISSDMCKPAQQGKDVVVEFGDDSGHLYYHE